MKNDKLSNKPQTFLENGFPLAELQSLALEEGNSKRPIYQIHKWWARRLGSVFRYLLISSFSPPHQSHQDFMTNYYNGISFNDKVIYDPMIGGGTSVIEGLKLGCTVIGSDINPVAWFVTKKEIEEFDEDLADKYYNALESDVGNKIKKFYKTSCPNGHACESVYSLWVRMVTCKNCKKQSDIFNDLTIKHDEKQDVVICPKCDRVFYTKQKGVNIKCTSCKLTFNKNYKTIHKGIFTCSSCDTKERVVDNIRRLGKFLPTRMFCIEYDCKICGRGFKSPSKRDFNLFNKAKRIFLNNKTNLPFPKQLIPDQHSHDRRPITHGFKYFHELFNPRQLLSLSLLLKEIKKIPDENIREFLLLTFSSSLETNNVLCKYETNWGKISALFGMPTYHVPERYGENNVWGDGRGSFPRTYLKLKRGKRYAQNAYEVIHKKRVKKTRNLRVFTGEKAIANYSKSTILEKKVRLYCRDSSNMTKIMDPKSVDAVVTDPPYFDTIKYSRLADFFYVWLRLALKDRYPSFKEETSKRHKEIVADEYSETSRENFVSGLTKILLECHRVLKDSGILVFTFHHTQKWAWIGLRKALHDAGFYVTATPILRSEGRTGFRKEGNTSYDVCIACRKSQQCKSYPGEISTTTLRNCLKTVRSLKKSDNMMKSSDVFTVLMSKYLRTNDSTAEKIMNTAPMLVNQIRYKAGIKNS